MKVILKDQKLASHRVKVKPTCFHKNVSINTVMFFALIRFVVSPTVKIIETDFPAK